MAKARAIIKRRKAVDNIRKIAFHENDSTRFHGNVCSASHGDS